MSRDRGDELQLLLSDFAIERLLYRLGASPYVEAFVLKGAMLLRLWSSERHRATWDVDLLGRGDPALASLESTLRALCAIESDDGITFSADSVRGSESRIADDDPGVRLTLEALLAGAVIPVQVDIGFGDAVVPQPCLTQYPTLLGHAAPRILVYPRETVVAEKLDAILTLGVTNSRVKDYFDLDVLARGFAFDAVGLRAALHATFARRGTLVRLPEPVELSMAFLTAPERAHLWRAFWKRTRTDGTTLEVRRIAEMIRSFALPLLGSVGGESSDLSHWHAGGPWR